MHNTMQGLMSQQSNARPVSGEALETMGKKAASLYLNEGKKLNDAVVETVKHAGLSPEQVRRVVEFANQSAYLEEFKKEGTQHRVIEFDGGPADPAAVLQDLNDGGGGTVFDRGTLDYNAPPRETKIASAAAEQAFVEMLKRDESPMLQANPMGDLIDLKEKIAGAFENQTSILTGLEGMYLDLSENLYGQVKQAAMSGYALGEVLQAWEPFVPSAAHVEAAFQIIGPRLVKEGVFNEQQIQDSFAKTGASRMANPEHPLIVSFVEFCDTLSKLSQVRATQEELRTGLNQVHNELASFPKAASATSSADREKVARGTSPGFVRNVLEGFKAVGKPAGNIAGKGSKVLFGEESPWASAFNSAGKVTREGHVQKLTEGVISHIPHALAGALAVRGAQHASALGETPTGHAVKSFIPGTPEYQQKNQELAMNYGGFPYPVY